MEEKLHSISIVGTGLIGASLGRALMGSFLIKGFDRNPENVQTAVEIGAVEYVCKSVEEVFSSDLILISIPVQFIPVFLNENRENFKTGSVVMDTGSTKKLVVDTMKHLPETVEFVGGHPIAGKEKSGPHSADENLFRGKKFVLTNENRLTENGSSLVKSVIQKIGARPVFMSAEFHDRVLAYTSHFPYFVASALFDFVLKKEREIPEIFEFAGTGLKDTTRIASGDVEMSLGMLETNKENIVKLIDEFMQLLSEMREKFNKGELAAELKAVKERRDKIWK